MGRLRLYTHADGRTAVHEAGFSWLAALALPMWTLQHRLRLATVAAYISSLVPALVGTAFAWPMSWSLALQAVSVLTAGALAAPLHAAWLRRSGWTLTAEEPAAAAARRTP